MKSKWKWSCSCLHSSINTPLCVHISGSSDLLTAPGQGCPTPGCNGVGHIRGPRYGTHYTSVACSTFFFFYFSLSLFCFFGHSFLCVSYCFLILVSYGICMIISLISLVNIFYISYHNYSE